MKIYNITVNGEKHVAVEGVNGIADATAAGFEYLIDDVVAGAGLGLLAKIAGDASLPAVENPEFADILNRPDKIICIGLNYAAHAEGTKEEVPSSLTLFSKFANALAPSGSDVVLPPWETTYDYEAELVVVMGKSAWNVSKEEAMDCVFGYTCGNDVSCRDPQKRSSQWLIGKTMPGFGPCGPCIVTKDSFDPYSPMSIRSYVNGELRQNGHTSDMISGVAETVSYASRYIALEPGDLIFTGTPSGVVLEKAPEERVWMKSGDVVDIVIEGIGTLTNRFV